MSTIGVLGGGISGLSAAYYLARFGPSSNKIVLIEGSKRVGGWVRSQRVGPGFYPSPTAHDQEGGILFEGGPRSLRPVGVSGAIVLDMIRDLGLANDLLSVPKSDPSAKNRYIYYDGSINTLPNSMSSMLFHRPPIFKNVLGVALCEPFKKANRSDEDESLYSLVSRRFNDHVALDLVGAMVHGIYAGDVKALSAQSTLRMLYENERVHGSIIKGMLKGGVNLESFRERGMAARARKDDPDWFGELENMSVIGFKNGTEMITHALRKRLEECSNVEIILDEPVLQVKTNNEGKASKITTTQQDIHVDHVISALPSYVLDRVLTDGKLPHLQHNPFADVAVVNLAYNPDVKLNYDGFGFLTPYPKAHSPLPVPGTLGVVFDSNAMSGQDTNNGHTKVTVMIGGHQWSNAFNHVPIEQLDPQDAYNHAIKAMHAYLSIDAKPEYAMVHLQAKCIPQYIVGHMYRMGELNHVLKSQYGHALSVTGASYLSVSVPDCIKNSRELVEDLLVAGALGSRDKIVTGLGRVDTYKDTKQMKESARLSKSHINILMKS